MTPVALSFLYIFAAKLLRLIGQTAAISEFGGAVCSMDDPAAVHVRNGLPDRQVPASAEQDHGDGGHRGSGAGAGAGAPHRVQLADDAEARVGAGRGRHRAGRVVGGHRFGPAHLHIQRRVREGLYRVPVDENLWSFVRLSLASAVMLW
ncbi:EPL1 domain-containing protein [Psidium guajava]|nr:EPL1 domain-containing protein [Psidium guajava]